MRSAWDRRRSNRAVNEGDDFKFDIRWLLPLIRATGDSTVLDHLCEQVDSVRVKLPRCASSRRATRRRSTRRNSVSRR